MRLIDLRSDTITHPTPDMRQAMASAEVGDDVFGEDPTVKRLEEMAAQRMGMEDALFVASGTMANIVSQMVHCGRGDEMILGDQSHIFYYEQGGSAALGGIHPRTLPNQPDGTISLKAIEGAIRTDDVHFPRSRLIVLENTHNRCHGTPLTIDYLESVSTLARARGLRVHIDGARIFNAAAALDVAPQALARPADSISFCLSKGLAAPAGSLVCSSREFIRQARRVRKVLGGGMRQAGVLAAAGIVALEQMVARLADDHANARQLALGLDTIPGIRANAEKVKTNIVYVDITHPDLTAATLVERLQAQGVRVLPTGPSQLRAVTHYHITVQDIETALGAFHSVL
jgi:threonine aldolase